MLKISLFANPDFFLKNNSRFRIYKWKRTRFSITSTLTDTSQKKKSVKALLAGFTRVEFTVIFLGINVSDNQKVAMKFVRK